MAKHLHDVTGRDMLRPQWNEIDFDLSDQARKVPVPPQQAEAAAGGTVIDLPARESW